MPAPAARTAEGIALMTLAMLSIPAVDAIAKLLTAGYAPPFIGWARYVASCAVALPLAAALHGSRLFPAGRRGSHWLRSACHAGAMTLFFFAVARIPLATAVAAYFVAPIAAVVLAVPLLGERLTVRKGASLALGIAGALVILRPGAPEPGILLALGAGLGFAAYIIATRVAARDAAPVRTLAFQCAAGTAMLTPLAALTWQTPAWADLPLFAAMGVLSAASHLMSIAAFRRAEASILAPLVYLELLGATVLGFALFGDVPDLATLAGAALIVGGGLVLAWRSPGAAAPASTPDVASKIVDK